VSTAPPIDERQLPFQPAPAGRRRRSLAPYAMVAPLILVLLLVLMVPLIRLVVVSLQKYGLDQLIGGKPTAWAGLAQFGDVLSSADFWSALRRTVQFVVAAVALTIGLGLALAHLLAKVAGPVRVFLLLSLVTVVDAADHRNADLAVVDRPAIRRPELRIEHGRRPALPKLQLVPATVDRLDDHHRDRRLGRVAVRGDQPACRPGVGVDRSSRGGPVGRRGRLEGVHRGHVSGHQTDIADHRQPVDHLGLPGVRPDLVAQGHRREQGRLLHDRNLVLRGILLQQELRLGCGHLFVSVLLLGGLSAFAVRNVLRSTAEEGSR